MSNVQPLRIDKKPEARDKYIELRIEMERMRIETERKHAEMHTEMERKQSELRTEFEQIQRELKLKYETELSHTRDVLHYTVLKLLHETEMDVTELTSRLVQLERVANRSFPS